jgi:hypothetical protein
VAIRAKDNQRCVIGGWLGASNVAARRAGFRKSFRFRRATVIVPANAALIRDDVAFGSV